MRRRGYFERIARAARTTAEGLAVTLAQYFRRPTTVQYPDRVPVPVVDSLPERYRGFLEVDLAICTACKACERDCPINCIAIDVEKRGDQRGMTRFDIDMGKCMYCNLCVESCPVPAQAPGDAEPTKCIRMTREFEGATGQLETLTFRFVAPGAFAVPFKPKKGEVPATSRRGEIARHVRSAAREYNPVAFKWAYAFRLSAEEVTRPEVLEPRAGALAARVGQTGGDAQALEALLLEQVLPRTDCEKCGHPTCRAYAAAVLDGSDADVGKCEPGGPQATRDLALVRALAAGKAPAEAAEQARAEVLRRAGL